MEVSSVVNWIVIGLVVLIFVSLFKDKFDKLFPRKKKDNDSLRGEVK